MELLEKLKEQVEYRISGVIDKILDTPAENLPQQNRLRGEMDAYKDMIDLIKIMGRETLIPSDAEYQ